MASSPQSYQKRQRELRKKERKAEKQAIRHGRSAAKAEEVARAIATLSIQLHLALVKAGLPGTLGR